MLKESIFRRINREDYRQQVAYYFPFGHGRYPRRFWLPPRLVIAMSVLYGLCLSLSYEYKREWFEAVISRSQPLLEERLTVYVPSISKMAENLARYGHSEVVPLAQHIYALCPVFFVLIFAAGVFYAWFSRATPARLKRWFVIFAYNADIDYRIIIAVWLFRLGAVMLLWWYIFAYGGVLHGGFFDGDDDIFLWFMKLFLFGSTSFASAGLLFVSGWCGLAVTRYIIFAYYGFRRWYVNIRRERKMRDDAAAADGVRRL